MHILLTGATGYIGKRLLQSLLLEGHTVTCCVRNPQRFNPPDGFEDQIRILVTDFSKPYELSENNQPVDAAYYLIHSLSTTTKGYQQSELTTAQYFRELAEQLKTKQVIYLGGMLTRANFLSTCQVEKA